MKNIKQTDFFAKKSHRFGGDTRSSRASRLARPVSVRQSMHLILKSQHAKGDWSFLRPRNKLIVRNLLKKYSKQFGVKIFSSANVGNHVHIHAKFHSHQAYKNFVRVLTGAISLKITGASKLRPISKILTEKHPAEDRRSAVSTRTKSGAHSNTSANQNSSKRFWTQSPYTRFVFGITDFMRITDYIKVNQLEGFGHPRALAEGVVKNWDYLYDGFD